MMGAVATEGNGGGNFENPEEGSVAARCYGVVEIGTHEEEYKGEKKKQRKVLIFWEIDQQMADGRPFVVNKWYTNSLGERANLRKDLKAWRRKDFTDAELKKFALGNIINQPCLLNLSKNENTGKIFVSGVMPLPKGMEAPPLENEVIDFGICDLGDEELWNKLYPWLQNMIMKSEEYKAYQEGGLDEGEEEAPF